MCRFLGRRNDVTLHALMRPASEKRQGTKSRSVVHRRCGGRYRELTDAHELEAERFFTAVGLERMHNLDVMARSLLIGDLRFRALCDFNELCVAEIAHSATLAR
jgi:hypothetical protein